MKTTRLLGFLTALVLFISVTGCAPTYYSNRHAGYAVRRHHPHAGYNHPVPPRPYGGYGRPGW